jgi:hypothetical protein
MSHTLVINSKKSFGSGNNTCTYDFIQGNFNIPRDSEVMVANVQIPYSFYNITPEMVTNVPGRQRTHVESEKTVAPVEMKGPPGHPNKKSSTFHQ